MTFEMSFKGEAENNSETDNSQWKEFIFICCSGAVHNSNPQDSARLHFMYSLK